MPIKVTNCLKVHTTKFAVTNFRISDARSRLNCPYILFLSRMLGMWLIELAPLYKLFDYFTFHLVPSLTLFVWSRFLHSLRIVSPKPSWWVPNSTIHSLIVCEVKMIYSNIMAKASPKWSSHVTCHHYSIVLTPIIWGS